MKSVNTNYKQQKRRNSTTKPIVIDLKSGLELVSKPAQVQRKSSVFVQDADVIYDTDATWYEYQRQAQRIEAAQQTATLQSATQSKLPRKVAGMIAFSVYSVSVFTLRCAWELAKFFLQALRIAMVGALKNATQRNNAASNPQCNDANNATQYYDMRNNNGNITVNNHYS